MGLRYQKARHQAASRPAKFDLFHRSDRTLLNRWPFSVLMSVYVRENPAYLRASLDSVLASSIQPDEVVLVEDGAIGPELHAVIDSFRARLPIVSVPLAVNVGLPGALNAGLAACRHEFVARFDTDDLCLPQRFELQTAFLAAHPGVAAVGAAVQEFDLLTGRALAVRAPPSRHEELCEFARLSSPFNHPATMFRKSAVLAVGAYPAHMTVAFEDYALWIKLILAGHRLANLPDVLVQMRAGTAQAGRRRGWRYARQEVAFANTFRRLGFFSAWQWLRFIALRVPVRFLPKQQVVALYQRFARQQRPNAA
jgi:glycosyltransferase involved in cell wall biosynthesis